MSEKKKESTLRRMVHKAVERHYEAFHREDSGFIPGKTYIPYAGRVYDADEIKTLVDSSMDFWLTQGRFAKKFEKEFARFLGVKHCILTNSGSSANLLAISALTSRKFGKKRLAPGNEVITAACAFPTTVNPIIQNGLIPVFLDADAGTYNINVKDLKDALSKKTKAIFLAHTLGNPFNLGEVIKFARKHDLWVIEDASDALGAKFRERYTGTFGHIATFSFYPAHHITMGEGGALVTNDVRLKNVIVSFRDWGRDCWCEPGSQNTCGKRFSLKRGSLPYGYDHKYVYSHIGYNLKITDMQAAVGCAQLKKLPSFLRSRKRNWKILYNRLRKYARYFVLPEATCDSEPSWFGFILAVKKDAPFSRNDIVNYLEQNKIATRALFAGNIIRHPSFEGIKFRVCGSLRNTDYIMNNAFWVGVYPGMTEKMLDFVASKIEEFCNKRLTV